MLSSVVFDHLNHLTRPSMIAVEIGIVSIGDVNANILADLKPFY